jgi:hypothetical protein
MLSILDNEWLEGLGLGMEVTTANACTYIYSKPVKAVNYAN